jgi:hypothetical protein
LNKTITMAVLEEARGLPLDDAPRHEQPARSSLTASERMGHWAHATNWPLSESGRWESVCPGDDYEVRRWQKGPSGYPREVTRRLTEC